MDFHRLLETAHKQMVSYLSKEGQRIINEAYWSKAAKNRSGNMHDAYGYGVYQNGVLVKKGYVSGGQMTTKPHHGWAKHNIPSDTGRGYVDAFLMDYASEVNPIGYSLVCVNAIYYTQILEDGAQGRPHVSISTKYRIISQVASDMENLKNKFKGSKVKVISPTGRLK